MSIEWYAIHTYVGHEEKVRENILNRARSLGATDRIYQVVVPTEETVEHGTTARREVGTRTTRQCVSDEVVPVALGNDRHEQLPHHQRSRVEGGTGEMCILAAQFAAYRMCNIGSHEAHTTT